MEIGNKLKQLRIQNNLTMEELGNRCDLSKGFISQLERDLTSPSITTLMDILECLGTDLTKFFNDTTEKKVVFTEDDIFTQDNEESNYKIQWIIPTAQKNAMEPILIHIHKGGSTNIYPSHDGEIFGYVISGSITINIGENKHTANANESFYYKAYDNYSLDNNGDDTATVLWVSTPPSF